MLGMMRELRAAGNESHASGDQGNSQPAQGTDMLVQQESLDQREQHVPQRSRRQNVSEIRPRKRGNISDEKRQQQKNPNRPPRIQNGEDNALQMIERDAAGVFR